jgi:hypothetical protein
LKAARDHLFGESKGVAKELHNFLVDWPPSPQEPSMSDERPRIIIPPAVPRGALALLSIALGALLFYAMHERGVASRVTAQNAEEARQLKDMRTQVAALNAKLDSIAEAGRPPALTSQQPVRKPASPHQKPDPRWRKLQTQLDQQGQAIESTRQELAGTRSDLQGSIAKTHEELVALERKGERKYFEFDLNKSKSFHPEGPVGVSLRKANTKHQYADLELLVDDQQLSKKHLNLYEPAIFYPTGERQPVELVINGISKDHIHGYISAARYSAAEVAAAAGADSGDTTATNALKTRPRLAPSH